MLFALFLFLFLAVAHHSNIALRTTHSYSLSQSLIVLKCYV